MIRSGTERSIGMMYEEGGYWKSNEYLEFALDKKIEDVEEFGNSLYAFLKWQAKEGNIPFKILEMYPLFTCRLYDGKRNYWSTGYVIIHVKRKSFKSYLNLFHSTKGGDETIVLEFDHKEKSLRSYQEKKSEYTGYRYTWKFKLPAIEAFKDIINKFCAGYWLGINTLLQDPDKGEEGK